MSELAEGAAGHFTFQTPLNYTFTVCILIVILSVIPILCGYVIYLGLAALITQASPALQGTVSVISSVIIFVGLRQLWVFSVRRRKRLGQRDRRQ